VTPSRIARQRVALLAWFEPRRRAYPWRRRNDAYAVLVGEVMLQQTQAPRVAPAFERFLERFPTVHALAGAARADVVRAWDGLGYNRRAVSLSLAARGIVEEHDGRVPRDPRTLRTLPGVGPYTAAAVASIAYGVPVAAVDTNARRVTRRVLAGRDDLDRRRTDALAASWLDASRPGEWNQAVMDLGRVYCRPRPACEPCPLGTMCGFAASNRAPAPASRRQPPFAGSSRQVRGDVVRALRTSRSLSIAQLAAATGHQRERVGDAVATLESDGIVRAAGVRVRLA
jgi:A/G-specific adenine glycosylase